MAMTDVFHATSLSRLLLQRRQHLFKRVWAEKGLQDLAEPGVLRRIERDGHQRQRAAEHVESLLRREQFGLAQRGQHVVAVSQKKDPVDTHHPPRVTQDLPSLPAVGRHRQTGEGELRCAMGFHVCS
jgi:hypothetical protein